VGGTPESVMRAVHYDLPMILAIIGGPAARFRPFADLYRRAADQAGQAAQPIGVHSPGHVAETDLQAKEELWPHYKRLLDRIGRERGWSPVSRDHFEAEAAQGALYVGSAETVARKDRKSTCLNSSHVKISYAVFCLKKKIKHKK